MKALETVSLRAVRRPQFGGPAGLRRPVVVAHRLARRRSSMLQRCSSVTLLATIYGHWWRSGMLTRPSDCSAESSFRDYLDISETLTMIRGPTDPIHAVGAVDRVRLEFTCEFDDFATDTPLNRLLKAAANRIALSPLLGWSVRRRALAIIARMEDGGPL